LIVVETSRSMQHRSDAVLKSVQDLLVSGMKGQVRRGDSLGIWTFNDQLRAGIFPLQSWSPETQKGVLVRAVSFLREQKYEKHARLEKVLPEILRIIKGSEFIT